MIPFWLLSLLASFFWLMVKMIPSWDRKWRGAEGWSGDWAVRTWQTEIEGWSSPPPPTAHTAGYNRKRNLKGTVARDSGAYEGWSGGWAVRTWQREIGEWSSPPPPTSHTAGYNKKGNLKGTIAHYSWVSKMEWMLGSPSFDNKEDGRKLSISTKSSHNWLQEKCLRACLCRKWRHLPSKSKIPVVKLQKCPGSRRELSTQIY